MQTIQQLRAKFALERVQNAANSLTPKEQKEYKSHASGLPAMIHVNGLGQAAAFYKSKGDTHALIYQLLSDWLTKPNQPYAGSNDLIQAITTQDMHHYRLAQAEAQALMDWVKKFAKAYMGGLIMLLPLYDILQTTKPQKSLNSNMGLWFERFFDHYGYNNENKFEVPKDGKSTWLLEFNKAGNKDALQQAACQQMELVKKIEGKYKFFNTQWHFVTGTGYPHPVENGLLWHKTYGVPYLSGAAVKGLVRAWVGRMGRI